MIQDYSHYYYKRITVAVRCLERDISQPLYSCRIEFIALGKGETKDESAQGS